jgi:Cell division protein FtsI/penicillin-binding protein 2
MKKVQRRALSVLIIIFTLVCGVGIFTFRFFSEGESWVKFSANRHVYSNGTIIDGAIYDRDGNPLLHTVDGQRRYSENESVRCATMHIIGDKKGNVANSLQKVYADKLVGYNYVTGMFSANIAGNKIYTTLDPDVCSAAYELLKGKKGAICVFNYKTGEVICLVSTPTYDPENPPVISEDDDSFDGVFLNRAISSRFTPGSVYKTVTAAAAIDTIPDINEQKFNCLHTITVNGQKIVCSGTHKEEDFRLALRNSCNVAFGEISMQLGWDTTSEYARKLGITTSHSLSGIPTIRGKIASSGGLNELAWTGIGQNTDEVSPYAMMRYMGIIANGGICVEPYIVEKITTESGIPLSIEKRPEPERILSQSTADQLSDMMRFTVQKGYGESNFPKGMEFCAKTGTAELDGGKKSHAWFVGFTRNEKYPYAFAVFVQNGGGGYTVAKPIASKVMEAVKNKVDSLENAGLE